MSSKFWAELSSDYEKLFEEIHAHSNILSISSQYFRTAFSNEWAEKKDVKIYFQKTKYFTTII